MKQSKNPFHIMAKPIGAMCNLRCDYCFYLEKSKLFPHKNASSFFMNDTVLEAYIKSYISTYPLGYPEIPFAWQGGEPTLLGIPFFQKVVDFQKKFTPQGITITNAFQTNGVLITDDFAQFFKDNNFLVGVSIDGPETLHNKFRKNINGEGSFKDVILGINSLQKKCVDFNLLTVVQSDNAIYPQEVYSFLKTLGSSFIQFIPIIEPDKKTIASNRSVSAKQWGDFLCNVFHEWRKNDIGQVFVQQFDVTLGLLMGQGSSICVHSPNCGRAFVLEHNGDLYSCDHFVDDNHFLGNILKTELEVLIESKKQKKFGMSKYQDLSLKCRKCVHLKLCYGGCPKDRLLETSEQGKMINWLCDGYTAFFQETMPYFKAMEKALNQKRPARDYLKFLKD